MSLLRLFTRISLLEWMLIIAVIGWFVRRPRNQSSPSASPKQDWLINICVGLTVIGILGGALWQMRWLSMLGFAAAVLGVAWLIRGWLTRIQTKIARLFNQKRG